MKNLATLITLLLAGCGQTTVNNYYTVYSDNNKEEQGPYNMGFEPPIELTHEPDTLPLEVFEHGNRYWFRVTEDELAAMNDEWINGGWGGDFFDGLYEVEETTEESGETGGVLLVQTSSEMAADFGRVQVDVVGESTGTVWATNTIPNLHVDADEFRDELRIGRYEHLRFNNGQVGSLFAEAAALATFNALGYPASQTAYAWVGGTPWQNPNVSIPYTVVEVYKRPFCEGRNKYFFGGGCENIWEGAGLDVGGGWQAGFENACQVNTCNTERLNAFAAIVDATYSTSDFDEATEPYMDWDAFHTFQCLEWLLWVGDDALHNFNNVVLTEGLDGKFRFLPYSTDISAGLAWEGAYANTPLPGFSMLAMGCQWDRSCWMATMDRCEEVIDGFDALNPATTIVDPLWQAADGHGMIRTGDDTSFGIIRDFYATRADLAREELPLYHNAISWVETYWGGGF